MPTEKINYEDVLKEGTDKLNKSIDNANQAEIKSDEAKQTSNMALNVAGTAEQKADSVQEQFNQVVIEGDSSVEAAQARVKADGTSFTTLQERLNSSDANLTETRKVLIAEGVNYIYVDALMDDANNGESEATAVKTLQKAFNILQDMGSKLEFGSWVIKVKGYGDTHTYNGARISRMPYISDRLLIEGDTDINGNPTTIFKKGNNVDIGIRVEPGIKNLHLKNVIFRDFANGFNGYGFLMKDRGYALIDNCQAYNCDNGFSGINNVTIITRRTISENCQTGYRCQYSSNGTFGAGSGGSLFDDGGNGSKAINCETGVFVSRNAVAHVDYMDLEDNTFAGVYTDMSCRVHVLGSHFRRNDIGVLTDGTAEWLNNRDEPNNFYEGTPDANRINYEHNGVSRESRLYSQRSKNMFRQHIDFNAGTLTGNTAKTVMSNFPSHSYIPKHFLGYHGRKVKVIVTGSMVGVGDKEIQIFLKAIDDDGVPLSPEVVIGGMNYNAIIDNSRQFKMEYELDTKGAGSYLRSGNSIFHLQPSNYVLSYQSSLISSNIYQLRVSGRLSDPNSSITLDKVEMYLMG